MTAGTTDTDPNRKVVLEPDAAVELIDLIRDQPGRADEDLLDEALDAFEHPFHRVPTVDQQRAAGGEVVAIEVRAEAIEAVTTLVRDDRPAQPRVLRRLAKRLRGKLDQASRRRRRR
jgi:hypothetical protein